MSGRGNVEGFDPEIEGALASVVRPKARPEFRESLRRRFCSGTPAQQVPPLSYAPLPELGRDPRVARRRRFLRFGGLLAAAAIAVIGYVFLSSPAPRWKVIELGDGSVVKIDGKAFPVEDRDALASELQRAKTFEVEKGDMILQVENLALFDISEGTSVSFEGFDRGNGGTEYELRVPSGRLRGVTGPAFHGRKMKVDADLFQGTIVGTAFAVDYEPHGTCLCCLDGHVEMDCSALHTHEDIPATKMCLIYRDGTMPPKHGDNPTKHSAPLKALEDRAHTIWR
jgi:hypothetical protein